MARELELLDPDVATAAQYITRRAREMGYDARIIQTYREPEEQKRLYKEGKFTNAKVSWHQFGKAFDIGLFDKSGKYIEDGTQYKFLGNIYNELAGTDPDLIWGGNWNKVDVGHFERHPGFGAAQQQQFINTKGYYDYQKQLEEILKSKE